MPIMLIKYCLGEEIREYGTHKERRNVQNILEEKP
jgi:hypothetical protein